MTAMSLQVNAQAAVGQWFGELWLTDRPLADPHVFLDRVADYQRTRLWPVLVPSDRPGVPPESSVRPEPSVVARDRHDPQAEAGIAGAVLVANGQPGYRLGLVEAARPADVPARLGRPGISRVLRDWEDRFGATLVVLGAKEMVLAVSAPPTALHRALIVAAEHRAFCQGVPGTLPQLSRGLIRLRRWHFRW